MDVRITEQLLKQLLELSYQRGLAFGNREKFRDCKSFIIELDKDMDKYIDYLVKYAKDEQHIIDNRDSIH